MEFFMDFNTIVSYVDTVIGNDVFKTSQVDICENIKENFSVLSPKMKQIGCEFKHSVETITFIKFVSLLSEWDMSSIDISKYTNNFLFGYKIPQINKEFDLLRFGDNYNINIELKSDTTIEEQEEQLKKNHFYLNFLPTKTRYISISPDINSYMEYSTQDNRFINLNPKDIIELFVNQKVVEYSVDEVNSFFNIRNYLVSPFNDVEKFLDNKYFLTPHQNEIVNEILYKSDKKVFGVKGNPGTGKSLLIYHICKKLMEQGKKVAIIHGANLNSGQHNLAFHGFKMFPIKLIDNVLNEADRYDYIILDEAQRLRQEFKQQYTKLVHAIENTQTKFIISLDGRQTINKDEREESSIKLFDYIKDNGKTFSLKNKFRTNPEMSQFIQLLFKIPIYKKIDLISNIDKNIIIKYFVTREEGNQYIESMDTESDWKVLNYTKDMYNKKGIDKLSNTGLKSHEVIGQEFDKVIIPLDSNFFYRAQTIVDDKTKEIRVIKCLQTTDNYYPLEKMLYQNVTRTREKIELVIIENRELFKEICSLVKNL